MAVVGVGGGKFYYMNYGDTAMTQVPLPLGVTALPPEMRPLPSFAKWQKDCFIAGYFSRVLRFTTNYELVEGGIHAPIKEPTMVAGASSGGSSGVAIGYITLAQERIGPNGVVITVQESNPVPSAGTAPVTLTGQGRSWGNLPTTSVDPRVTHVYGYVSMDGAIPRRAWKRELAAGVTTVTENVLTGSLGEELPSSIGVDGADDLEPDARGVVPYCKYAVPFHDTMVYAGFPDRPYVIAPSKLFEPESVNLQDDSPTAKVTPGREAVIGMIEHQASERLLIFCSPPRVYAMSGYGPEDYDIKPVNGFYELLSHATLRHVGPNADVWGASQEGPILFNGSFRSIMDEREQEWKDLLKANPEAFARSWAVYSNEAKASGYKLRVPIDDPVDSANKSFYFFGHDDPVPGGAQPWWTNDVRTREDTCAAEVKLYGQPWAEVWTGSADGYIRKEDVSADGSDDTDTLRKQIDLIHAHFWMPSQAGDENHGSKVANVDLYLKNEQQNATLELYAGDESAVDAVDPDRSFTVEAGAEPTTKRQKVAKTSRRFSAGQIASGKGVAVRLVISSPTNVEYRGLSISYAEGGQQNRPYSE